MGKIFVKTYLMKSQYAKYTKEFLKLNNKKATNLKMRKRGKCGQEDSELTFSHRDTKITTICQATIDEKDLNTSRRTHSEASRKGR